VHTTPSTDNVALKLLDQRLAQLGVIVDDEDPAGNPLATPRLRSEPVLFDKGRTTMEQWSTYCAHTPSKASVEVKQALLNLQNR
jgi:hypothetical protein